MQSLNLKEKNTVCIHFIARKKLKLSQFKNYDFPVLTAEDQTLEKLKKLISLSIFKPCHFIVDEGYFKSKLFESSFYTG
ncbi:MAG: hypothetical protein OXN83_01015, partial [Oligoflexia bacterium]|nr:hypothetical protein [Oligoflexia bacterium]